MVVKENWSSRFMGSLWSDTKDTWESENEDWRIVGTNPFLRRSESKTVEIPSNMLYIIEFSSKRLTIGYMNGLVISKNTHVILEADRGEDCGIVKGYTSKFQYEEFLKKYKTSEDDFKIKRIYRIATEKDINLLNERRKMAEPAIQECIAHIKEKGLKMEILDCEYQFDLKKITFFYKSDERVDFRELLNGLYKVFKTRIWLCSVDKSMDRLLIEILKE